MSKMENMIANRVVNRVVRNTTSRNESRIRQMIFQFWSEEENQLGCLVCLNVETYEKMIDKIFTYMNRH